MKRKNNKKTSKGFLQLFKARSFFILLVCIIISTVLVWILVINENTTDDPYLRGFLFDKAQMAEKGYIGLTRDRFAYNVVTYENKNGTDAVYIYSSPLELTDNSIETNKTGYLADGTYVAKHFPKVFDQKSLSDNENQNPSGGISYIDISIKGKPDNYINIFPDDTNKSFNVQYTKKINVFGENNPSICYSNVFGQDSDLYFYPTVYGVNSEIIIPGKNSAASYTFKIKVPEMIPETKTPDYIALQKRYADDINLSIISAPLLVDNSDKWNFKGQVKFISKDYSDGTYVVQFIPDMDFLNDRNTRFPVVMNQSFYLAHNNGNSDTSAYSAVSDNEARHYLSPYLFLGSGASKGEGRAYIRYEALNNMKINPENIISAKYCFRNLFDLPKPAAVGLYAVTSDWCGINTKWSTMPEYDQEMISNTEVLKKGNYSLDITPLLKKMLESKGKEDALYSVRNSFLIKSETPGSNMILESGDNGIYSPCLEIILKN